MSQQTLCIEQYIWTAHNVSSYFKLGLVTLSVKKKKRNTITANELRFIIGWIKHHVDSNSFLVDAVYKFYMQSCTLMPSIRHTVKRNLHVFSYDCRKCVDMFSPAVLLCFILLKCQQMLLNVTLKSSTVQLSLK